MRNICVKAEAVGQVREHWIACLPHSETVPMQRHRGRTRQAPKRDADQRQELVGALYAILFGQRLRSVLSR